MTTPEEIARIAKGLTKAQREAMVHPNAGKCSYSWTAMRTAEALRDRGLVRRVAGHGAFYSPRTAIEWPLTETGLDLRTYLMENPQ